MSVIDTFTESLERLLETAKELPTEKIAAIGLILLGTGAILKDVASGNVDEAIDKAKNLIDIN